MGLGLLSIIILIVVVGILFVNLSPQFGASPGKDQKESYANLDNFSEGKFRNLIPTSMDMKVGDMAGVMRDFIKGTPNGRPAKDLATAKVDSLQIVENKSEIRLIWFGHSAFLLQMDGKNILIDPMFGDVPAPHPWLGKNRFSRELPIEIEKLPKIDAIIISHDHYDHLDYGSIQKLKEKTSKFYVPLGVGSHFTGWGVDESQIHELNWWDQIKHENIELTFAPARHFSGRGMSDRNTTLWGSWIIKSEDANIYFSGDGGYGPHFVEIGEKYGPFDFAMMECGQYNERWDQIHMMPEETAQAAVDVQAKVMMPIHWGAFTLALHSWTDPVERVTKKAEELNMPVLTPSIGEIIQIDSTLSAEPNPWWEQY